MPLHHPHTKRRRSGMNAALPSGFMVPMRVRLFEVVAYHETAPKSGSKLHALQTLPRRFNVPETREAFGVRPACRRFRFMVPCASDGWRWGLSKQALAGQV